MNNTENLFIAGNSLQTIENLGINQQSDLANLDELDSFEQPSFIQNELAEAGLIVSSSDQFDNAVDLLNNLSHNTSADKEKLYKNNAKSISRMENVYRGLFIFDKNDIETQNYKRYPKALTWGQLRDKLGL